MKFITSKQSNGEEVKIFYQDIGTGRPVVLVHGWPLNSNMWQYQLAELPKHGLRCIAYDRRGFGYSDKPWDGYDYNTLADDLKALLDELDLNDVVLIGFSMAGGEVVRYFTKHGGNRISKVVLVSSIAPYMLQTEDNPDGVSQGQVEDIVDNLNKDHAGFLTNFGKQFYGVTLMNHPVSQGILDWSFNMAMQGSLKATIDCVHAFAETDFRSEMANINVPALVIHGDDDKTVPFAATSDRAAELIPNAQLIIYESEPHGLFYTSKDQLNSDIVDFINDVTAEI